MLFNSYYFIFLFLPLSLAGYYILNYVNLYRLAGIFLIGMSLWFYGYFNRSYLLIICGSIIANFLFAKIMDRFSEKQSVKKCILILGILTNVILIFYYKYFNFFLENINTLFHTSFALKNILLPLGISFFTFQQISFLVDAYRGETKDYSFEEYALFVSFFPQLVAGPVVLHSETIPQFRDPKKRRVNYANFSRGLYVFSLGLFKKIILADTFGRAVDYGFSALPALNSLETFIVSLCFTFQLYFDFSGYCDMAVGIGSLFNITLPQNFNSPYKACSIIEFWERWHRSLSGWLRDYVYIPLGGSRKGKLRTYFNLMITFLISGIWHGANLTFLVWGALHGIYQVVYRFYKKHCKWEMPKIIGVALTFAFVSLAWIFFRADSVYDAFYMIRYMGYNLSPLLAYHKMGMVRQDFYLIIGSVSFLFLVDFLSLRMDVIKAVDRLKAPVRWAGYLLLAALILAFHLHNGTSQQFIYFQL